MRKALPLFTALLLAGCGGAPDSSGNPDDPTTTDTSESELTDSSRTPAPPGVTPTAAPGVAFNYRYAFRLPALRIAPIQEQHAAACEKLGVSRCRITGMQYRQSGRDEVSAQLAFKLDPALARAFGREGIDAVTRAEGELTRADIAGTDVGSEIAAGTSNGVQIDDELARIERQLARSGLSAGERTELQRQAQELRSASRSNQAQQGARRAQLASTPMVFEYRAGETGSPIARAARNAFETFGSSLAALLVLALTLLPWLTLALLLWLLWLWANRRFGAALAGDHPA